MDVQDPDTLSIDVHEFAEVTADSLKITLTISGVSSTTGNEAFRKAEEVSTMMQGLSAHGISDQNLHLKDVIMGSKKGLLMKSSHVTYRLELKPVPADKLSDILTLLAQQQNVSVEHLDWRYSSLTEVKQKLLRTSLATSKKKAQLVAETLGVKLIGVHQYRESWTDPGASNVMAYGPPDGDLSARGGASASDQIDLPLTQTSKLSLHVKIDYRISSFEQETLTGFSSR